MQASSLPDEQTLVRLVVAKRQSTVARFSQDRTCLTAQGLLTALGGLSANRKLGWVRRYRNVTSQSAYHCCFRNSWLRSGSSRLPVPGVIIEYRKLFLRPSHPTGMIDAIDAADFRMVIH